MTLAGCASFGGNVKGSFSCAAPDGICAPSSNIDDRALAMISGDAAGSEAAPAGHREQRSMGSSRRTAAQPARLAPGDPSRTREKVLRIVFQPYIDERGRFHEASAVRAVVASGEWQQAALAGGPAIAAYNDPSESLADAVDRVDPPGGIAAASPDLPDPAAIAAARARAADPITAIKADVASRLAGKPHGPSAGPKAVAAAPSDAVTSSAPAVAAAVPPSAAAAGQGSTDQAAGAVPAAGSAAVDRVKADPVYQGIAASVATGARDAAARTGAEPASVKGGTVKAANFPAAVSEDH